MKSLKLFCLSFALFLSASAFAGGSEIRRANLNSPGTMIVAVEIGNGITYKIDPHACLCWVVDGSSMATFSCKHLSKYSELNIYINQCKEPQTKQD